MPQVQDLVRYLRNQNRRDLAVSFEALPQEMYLSDLVNLLYRCPIEQMQTDPLTRALVLKWQEQAA